MKSVPSSRAGVHPSIVLSALVEPLIRGRRVAVLGDASAGLAEELSERGARLVHAYDPDAARAAEALAKAIPGKANQVSYALLSGDFGVRDGAFDVVIVPDLSLFSDAGELLRRTRRICAASGTAVLATPNARAEGKRLVTPPNAKANATTPGYYELYDLVSLQFPHVRMLGQAPFVGYTVADFAASAEPEVSVDTSLLAGSEEPEYFIAVAGDRAVTLDPYMVIGLPWAEISSDRGAVVSNDRQEEARLALTEAQTRLLVLTAELDQLGDRQRIDNETRAAATLGLSSRVSELEQELQGRDGRLRETEGRAGDNHVRAERLTHQIRDLEEELRHQRDRATRLTKQLDDEKKARTKAELELGMIRGRVATPPDPAGTSPSMQGLAEVLSAELETARIRIDALASELDTARKRIREFEHASADTVRRTRTESTQAPPDAKLLHRLNELESAVTATLREAETAGAARDGAIERARRAEARAQRMLELEAALMSAEASKHDLSAQIHALEVQLEAGDPRVTELERRLADREQRLADGRTRTAELTAQIAELTNHLNEGSPIVADLEARLLIADAHEAELAESRAVAEAATAEVATLERALRERGQLVSALQRDLSESERIGKELILELVLASAASTSASNVDAPSAVSAEATEIRTQHVASSADAAEAADLRARLDALSQSAARGEADLQAATWRIAQLERELLDAGEGEREPGTVQRELEAALASARDELASVRRSLGAR